jgi:hypothetical protein
MRQAVYETVFYYQNIQPVTKTVYQKKLSLAGYPAMGVVKMDEPKLSRRL